MRDSNQPPTQPPDCATPNLAPRRRGPLYWIAVTFAAIGAIALVLLAFSIVFPADRVLDRERSNRIKSAANLRAIGQCILLYSNDNNGDYPDSFATILLNEDVISGVFVNPASNDTPATGPTTQAAAAQLLAGGHCSYIYTGRGLNAKTVDPNTIVAREILLNPTDGANMLFADGHVEPVDPAHTALIIAKSTASTAPVTMPSP